MAGFIIFIGGASEREARERLERVVSAGVYGAVLPPPASRWREGQEGTFADYATATEGDSIFFFSRRKLYGIGKLTNVGPDCKYCNFPGASDPQPYRYEQVKHMLLWDEGPGSENIRWICTFTPGPSFFENGVDIDDALSYRPHAFRALRAMDNVTFGRIDDEEEQALKDVLLRANQGSTITFPANHDATHGRIAAMVSDNYRLDPGPVMAACADPQGRLTHEMALEAGLLFQLAARDGHTSETFGDWDYLTHQLLASPFKPLKWADRIDIFGYRYMEGFRPTISRYLVAELKGASAGPDDVAQLAKYVDWVREEYTGGDYGPIEAYLVAHGFRDATVEAAQTTRRMYVVGRRPAQQREWCAIRLVKYRFSPSTQRLRFSPEYPPA
jgi:hypothetical protein